MTSRRPYTISPDSRLGFFFFFLFLFFLFISLLCKPLLLLANINTEHNGFTLEQEKRWRRAGEPARP